MIRSPEEFLSRHGTTEHFHPAAEEDNWHEQERDHPAHKTDAASQNDDGAGRISRVLDAHAWAKLDIPPTVRLLGELVTPASRTFLVGSTGVGKTLLAHEIAAGMACGSGFLHWRCDRPSRVLIIDGEMPDGLIKRRMAEVMLRHDLPPGALTLYSAARAEKIEEETGLPPMPPLNTPEGHSWVRTMIRDLKPDVLIFDNLMSLAPGNHAEPDTWLAVLPLVLDITKLGVAQIWCDHSGWDASRQYGSSTKAWLFDAVGIIKPVPEEQREPKALKVTLSFDAPAGKARRRTPENWSDFEPKTLTLAGGEWSVEGTSEAKAISPTAAAWLKDIVNVFAIPGLSSTANVSVSGVTIARVTLTRSQIRDALRKCGRIGGEGDGKVTGADRQLMSKWLTKLRELGKIGIDGEYIWLVSPAEGDGG